MRLSVTGAGGFIGRAVVRAALARGNEVAAVVRTAPPPGVLSAGAQVRVVGDLLSPEAQAAAVADCEAVIHLAGLVRARDADAFHRQNTLMTAQLAETAARAGCRRFVFASSLSVFPPTTPDGATLTDASPTAPATPYGASKLEAERRLAEIAASSGMSVVSLRPPAVFGPGADASPVGKLIKAVRLGVPLPLAGVRNRRSFIFSENLADAFVAACESDVQGAFIVTDSAPLSSARFVEMIAAALGRRARLFPAPPAILRRGRLAERLFGSMAVNGERFAETLGWRPAVDFEAAVARTVGTSPAGKGLSPLLQRR